MEKTAYAVLGVVVLIVIIGAAYFVTRPKPTPPPTTTPAPTTPAPVTIKIGYVVSTPIEEPWVGVIHHACQRLVDYYAKKGVTIVYDYAEKVDYADIPRVMREYAGRGFTLIIADVFGCEGPAREVAKDFPNVYFLLGSGLGPVDPNVAVFDDWIHEPAYLCGMIAGKLTKTNIIGVVGGYAIPEVNRLINAFKYGAKEVNPDVKVKIAFIESWFDPPKAKEAAISMIEAGADVMYAERYGVHEACQEYGIPCFGNLLDQWELAPDVIITGPCWNMTPCVMEAINMILENRWRAIDMAEWTMMAKGGAYLADWHDWENRLRPEIVQAMKEHNIIDMVNQRIEEIKSGLFKVPIDETVPVSD